VDQAAESRSAKEIRGTRTGRGAPAAAGYESAHRLLAHPGLSLAGPPWPWKYGAVSPAVTPTSPTRLTSERAFSTRYGSWASCCQGTVAGILALKHPQEIRCRLRLRRCWVSRSWWRTQGSQIPMPWHLRSHATRLRSGVRCCGPSLYLSSGGESHQGSGVCCPIQTCN